MYTEDLTDIYNAISEEPDADFVLSSGPSEVDEHNVLTGIATDTEDVLFVASYEEFEDLVADLDANCELPVIVRVWTNGPLFDFEVSADSTHVLNITGYVPGPPAMIEVDNQWGDGQDFLGSKALPLAEFYLAMLPPGSPEAISILQSSVDEGREPGKQIDLLSELDLLRHLSVGHV